MEYTESLVFKKDPVSSYSSLNRLGEEIMSIWEGRVRSEVETAGDLLRPALRDSLPKFLNLLADAMKEKDSRGLMEEASGIVREHAGERARETRFGPPQVIQELQVLREEVTSRLEKELNLSKKDYETIQKTFDQAIQEGLVEFFLVHVKIREQFMATLSHDLRNPIGVAKMGCEVIQDIAQEIRDSNLREDIIGLTNRIIANMKRADRMIQDLLDASILRIGERIPINISKCDLLTIIHDVVTEIDERDRSRIQIIGSPAIGFWDCEGLKRGLENLVKNSIKYGAAETPITIQILKADGRVQVSVHNYGNSISEQDQKLIFHPFARSSSAQTSGLKGWGLGLALVRTVSESLGGSANVKSSKEAGTTFTIDLPEDSRDFQISPVQMH